MKNRKCPQCKMHKVPAFGSYKKCPDCMFDDIVSKKAPRDVSLRIL